LKERSSNTVNWRLQGTTSRSATGGLRGAARRGAASPSSALALEILTVFGTQQTVTALPAGIDQSS
jgi:hypothetical protein